MMTHFRENISAMNNQTDAHNQFGTIVGLWAAWTALGEVSARTSARRLGSLERV
jgi:hypothetical protein